MPDEPRNLDHIQIHGRSRTESYTASPGGPSKRREVDRSQHGNELLQQAANAFTKNRSDRRASDVPTALEGDGTLLTIVGSSVEDGPYPLQLDSLDQKDRGWELRSVHPATREQAERATVLIEDQHQERFQDRIRQFRDEDTKGGNPRNADLVANITRLENASLEDLWQSPGQPDKSTGRWWELWLAAGEVDAARIDILERYADGYALRLTNRTLLLESQQRVIKWIHARWPQLENLLHTAVPLAEIRKPSIIETVEDLSIDEQNEYALDLADRVLPADEDSTAVCLLDSGVARNHVLLQDSLTAGDLHTILGESGFDVRGHGTKQAGVALYGSVDSKLLGTGLVVLRHRLESVRILPGPGERDHSPLDYGSVTAQGAALPETTHPRRRVFCLANSRVDETSEPGEPTLWSATVDALASGAVVAREGEELRILEPPDSNAARLFIIAAGNVPPDEFRDPQRPYLQVCDSSVMDDPAQAWNAITVGAFTELSEPPRDPDYDGWNVLAEPGELSPYSRTSTRFGSGWPIKPDVCLEGGNVIRQGDFPDDGHAKLSLRSTGARTDATLTSTRATSAAAAQAARLAALAMERYPGFWPETVRGLLVHTAEWTPPMWRRINGRPSKKERAHLLRRYGWGVPTEEAVLNSSRRAVTMVVQDTIPPFESREFKLSELRLHNLPWPAEVLANDIEFDNATLTVTLSYFIEPSASKRGWRSRYGYSSHNLRFDLKGRLESEADFLARLNRDDTRPARNPANSFGPEWAIGPRARDKGSLHKDIWTAPGVTLAEHDAIAVYPVGGWWKRSGRSDRGAPVRYALLVSLSTETDVDLYTPIVNQLTIPVATPGS